MDDRKILLVDDEPERASLLLDMLSGAGYMVLGPVQTGEEAVALAGDDHPDLAIISLFLSGEMDSTAISGRLELLYEIPSIMVGNGETVPETGVVRMPESEREIYGVIEMAVYRQRVEAKVRADHELVDATLALVSDAVLICDRQGIVLRANPSALSLLGLEKEEISGMPLSEVFGLGDEISGDLLARFSEGDGPVVWPGPLRVLKGDGEALTISLSGSCITDPSGRGAELIFVIRNQAYALNLLNILPDPVFILDSEMVPVMYNTALSEFCKSMGFPSPDAGDNIYDSLPSFLIGRADDYTDLFDTGISHEITRTLKTEGQTEINFSLSYMPVSEAGEVTHIATLIRNITTDREEKEETEQIRHDFQASQGLIEAIADLCLRMNEPLKVISRMLVGREGYAMEQLSEKADEAAVLISEINMNWVKYENYRRYLK